MLAARSSAMAWPRLHSFSVGLPGSPDLKAAAFVAKFLDTVHHEHTFTVQEGLDAIEEVIYHLETYDVTTIRASTPMYLLSRKIKAQGVKMVLSGEGSDEIFAGELYTNARKYLTLIKNRARQATCISTMHHQPRLSITSVLTEFATYIPRTVSGPINQQWLGASRPACRFSTATF